MKAPHTRVTKQVGMNPVAQAVARERLRQALLDMRIAVYMLTDGEACADLLGGAAVTMQAVLTACQVEGRSGVDVGILKGGLNACTQVVLADKFDTQQTIAIVRGLDMAVDLAKTLRPESINKAWNGVVQ